VGVPNKRSEADPARTSRALRAAAEVVHTEFVGLERIGGANLSTERAGSRDVAFAELTGGFHRRPQEIGVIARRRRFDHDGIGCITSACNWQARRLQKPSQFRAFKINGRRAFGRLSVGRLQLKRGVLRTPGLGQPDHSSGESSRD